MDGELLLSIVQKRVHDCVNPLICNELVIELDSMPENPVLMGAAAIAAQQVLSAPGQADGYAGGKIRLSVGELETRPFCKRAGFFVGVGTPLCKLLRRPGKGSGDLCTGKAHWRIAGQSIN